MKRPRKSQPEETTEFVGYLREHPASTTLADAIADLLAVRRAAAARRAQAKLHTTPVAISGGRARRVAS